MVIATPSVLHPCRTSCESAWPWFAAVCWGRIVHLQHRTHSFAHSLLPPNRYSGYVQLGFHWLKMEVAAERALLNPENALHDAGFYKSKVQTANFYYENLLPSTTSLKTKMLAPTSSIMDMKAENFSYDHSL